MSEVKLSKDYLIKSYRQALLDFYGALNDEEQWSARRTMARLEQLAMLQYSFDFADELRTLALETIEDLLVLED